MKMICIFFNSAEKNGKSKIILFSEGLEAHQKEEKTCDKHLLCNDDKVRKKTVTLYVVSVCLYDSSTRRDS